MNFAHKNNLQYVITLSLIHICVALYGTDWLIADKKEQLATSLVRMTGDNIRLREELSEQIRALGELAKLGEIYGYDITKPASNAKEAIQWLYFGYLAAVKEQNGAAMSLGRTSTFLDIYIQRDLERGLITEEPVSYTHLDVYKRQAYRTGLYLRKGFLCPLLKCKQTDF